MKATKGSGGQSATRRSSVAITPHPIPPRLKSLGTGWKLLAHVEEFSLYEAIFEEETDKAKHGELLASEQSGAGKQAKRSKGQKKLVVASAPHVNFALRASQLGISSRGDAAQRTKLAIALVDLMEDAAGQFAGDREELMDSLTEHLGGLLLGALNRSEGSQVRIRSAASRIKKVLASVESAVRQIQRYRTKIPTPKDKSRGSWTWAIQLTAKDIFRDSRTRPRQQDIWDELEAQGWVIKGNDIVESKRKKMTDAGLAGLPT